MYPASEMDEKPWEDPNDRSVEFRRLHEGTAMSYFFEHGCFFALRKMYQFPLVNAVEVSEVL